MACHSHSALPWPFLLSSLLSSLPSYEILPHRLKKPFLDGHLRSAYKIQPGKASPFHTHMENALSWCGDLPPSQTLFPHASPLRPSQYAEGCCTPTGWESFYLDLCIFLPLHVQSTLPQYFANWRASQSPNFRVLAHCC